MQTFHERLRATRIEKGFTQEQLAKAVGVTKSTMAKYDRGELEPNVKNIKKIAQVLGVSVDYLLYDNIKVSADDTDKEILGIIHMMDDKGKRFILDIAERYIYYHNKNNNP